MWVMIVATIIALSCNIAIKVVTKFNVSSCNRSYPITSAQQEDDIASNPSPAFFTEQDLGSRLEDDALEIETVADSERLIQ